MTWISRPTTPQSCLWRPLEYSKLIVMFQKRRLRWSELCEVVHYSHGSGIQKMAHCGHKGTDVFRNNAQVGVWWCSMGFEGPQQKSRLVRIDDPFPIFYHQILVILHVWNVDSIFYPCVVCSKMLFCIPGLWPAVTWATVAFLSSGTTLPILLWPVTSTKHFGPHQTFDLFGPFSVNPGGCVWTFS